MTEFRQLRGSFLNMDLREMGKLYAFFVRYPKAARAATAQVLNDMAFAWRPLAVSTLASRFIIRNPKFILSRMQVVKTTAKPISQQQVTLGSTFVRGKGHITFDGFYTLQTGRDPERSRTMALLARGGDKRAQVKRSNRLLPDSDIVSTDDAPVLHGSRAQALIRDMARNVPNKPFIIRRGYGLPAGLYRINKGKRYLLPSGKSAPKLQIVQHFGRKPKHERWQWMQESVNRLLKHSPMQKLWNAAIAKVTADAIHRAGVSSTHF